MNSHGATPAGAGAAARCPAWLRLARRCALTDSRARARAAGYVHETVTLRSLVPGCFALANEESAEFSWFPGYAWTIASCGECGAHIGWLFRTLRPRWRASRLAAALQELIAARTQLELGGMLLHARRLAIPAHPGAFAALLPTLLQRAAELLGRHHRVWKRVARRALEHQQRELLRQPQRRRGRARSRSDPAAAFSASSAPASAVPATADAAMDGQGDRVGASAPARAT